ncbi:hypothetical protein [Methylocystis sp. ATCC 49242]|uniref:hypothetical protein n=1 Tax=Methylocystis sp. ATCC 49242 TaxID=622637 RepID=UPI0001F8829E|nr:hypothetical protein [Methylocystis sp. ATCC 49242]
MKLLLAILVTTLIVIAAFFILFSPGEESRRIVEAEMAGARFVYARAYARDETTGAGGLADRLAFVASFPAFTPLTAKQRAAGAPAVMLTVTPKDDSLDPAERPGKLYARFLTADALAGPGGLVKRHFEQGSPYDFEELYIAPPDGRIFFARCPKAHSGAASEACLSVFRDGAFDVELRFPPVFLENWDALYDGARGLLTRMTKAAARKKR